MVFWQYDRIVEDILIKVSGTNDLRSGHGDAHL
jgi:hypothetical protein